MKIDKKIKKSCFEEHSHSQCVAHAMATASELCTHKGVRLTDLRFHVLHTIWKSQIPIGAYEILSLLQQDLPKTAPISVYRALDFLIEQGLIHRLNSSNTFLGCRFVDQEHIWAFLICSKCKKAQEIKLDKAFKDLKKTTGGYKFKPSNIVIEISGVCSACRT